MTSKIDPSVVPAAVNPSSVQSRIGLSFRAVDPDAGLVEALSDSAAAWSVPRDLPYEQSLQTGRQFFAEVQALAANNPDEARKAFLELFLFGWRAPFSQVTGRQTQINPDNLVNRDIAGNCGIEWGFLLGLADAALGVQTEGV